MTTITNPFTALRSFLRADTSVNTITQGRVFAGEIPDSEVSKMPRESILLTGAGGGIAPYSSSYIEISDQRMDMFCYGPTPVVAFNVYQALHGALKQMRRNVQGQTLLHWAILSGGAQTLRQEDTEWPLTLSTWQVLWSERAVSP